MDWVYGLLGSFCIAGAAYWKRSLSGSGMLAAILVGTLLFALGSLVWFGLLIGFFVSSTLLSKWKKKKKEQVEVVYQKTGRRDAGQVAANGGLGVLLCVIAWFWPAWDWTIAAFVGVMATVTADTWATEVGSLSKTMPRSILSGQRVSRGTSGAISGLGWIAAAAGGLFIGVLALVLAEWDPEVLSWMLKSNFGAAGFVVIAVISGWLGANVDSLLGATVQAMYRCPSCGREVEAKQHCGQATVLLKGWRSMDNDAVNLISSAAGGLFMVLGMKLLVG